NASSCFGTQVAGSYPAPPSIFCPLESVRSTVVEAAPVAVYAICVPAGTSLAPSAGDVMLAVSAPAVDVGLPDGTGWVLPCPVHLGFELQAASASAATRATAIGANFLRGKAVTHPWCPTNARWQTRLAPDDGQRTRNYLERRFGVPGLYTPDRSY